MRFGCCTSLDLAGVAAEVGFDFVELSTQTLAPEAPDEAFAPIRQQLAGAGARAEVWELAIPSDAAVCGPTVDWPRVSRFVNTTLRRVAVVGGSVVVIPLGAACQVPPGFPHDEALAQLCDFLRVCGAVARGRGLVIAIGALPPPNAGLVQSLPEAMALARRLDLPELGVLATCWRTAGADHSAFDVVDAAAWLAHVRMAPANDEGHDAAQEWAEALRLADYGGRIGVLGEWRDPRQDMARALAAARELFRNPSPQTSPTTH